MRWTDQQVATAVEMYAGGVMPAEIAKAVGRTPRAVAEKLLVVRAISDTAPVRGPGRPSAPATAYRDSRTRERDRARKQLARLGLVERSLRLTDAQAAIVAEARARGGFRTPSELVAALLRRLPA